MEIGSCLIDIMGYVREYNEIGKKMFSERLQINN